jgi:hypothetical protein
VREEQFVCGLESERRPRIEIERPDFSLYHSLLLTRTFLLQEEVVLLVLTY